MDERVVLPPLPPVAPFESAYVLLVRELYQELGGRVLASKLRAVSWSPPFTGDDEVAASRWGRHRERIDEARRTWEEAQAARRRRAAPLDYVLADAIVATRCWRLQGP